jgi:ankyrin repeat protein
LTDDGPRPRDADPGSQGFAVPDLPARPSLEHLRKQAKARRRERGIELSRAQFEIAREYGFDSWPKLVHHVEAAGLTGIERALVLASADDLAAFLGAASAPIDGLPPLLVLLRRSTGTPADIRACAALLLDAGADPNSHEPQDGGQWRRTALYEAVERGDLALVRLLLDRGAARDEDAFYHACEQSDLRLLDVLYEPGFERLAPHKLDFEDVDGLRWFLDHGLDVNATCALHHAIVRGRGLAIIEMLLDAGADMNKPWTRWDVGRRPLAVAARSGHLAAYELLAARGATADLDPVDEEILAVARGESARLPVQGRPPGLGNASEGHAWLLGQFAHLGRRDVVRSLLDAGMDVDTPGWSGFTPLQHAAAHGRAEMVRFLLARGADPARPAWDEGPNALSFAVWGRRNSRTADGDYVATVRALLAAGAPVQATSPTGDAEIDALVEGARLTADPGPPAG